MQFKFAISTFQTPRIGGEFKKELLVRFYWVKNQSGILLKNGCFYKFCKKLKHSIRADSAREWHIDLLVQKSP